MAPEKTVSGYTEETPVTRALPNVALEPSAILTVSPFEEDLTALRRIFSRSKWKLYQCHTCSEAVGLLNETPLAIVIADRAVPGGGWKRLAHELRRVSPEPKLIVAHRFSEAHEIGRTLTEGAYHAVAKPFRKSEVFQSVGFALQQWKREQARKRGPALGSMSAVL